jgi:hypothetical protein
MFVRAVMIFGSVQLNHYRPGFDHENNHYDNDQHRSN